MGFRQLWIRLRKLLDEFKCRILVRAAYQQAVQLHESVIDIISCRREKFFQMRPGFIQPVGAYKQRGQGLARIDRIGTDVYPYLGCLKRRRGLARLKRDFSCALCHSRVPRRLSPA